MCTYADTHHIQTFDDVFQNNFWIYINLKAFNAVLGDHLAFLPHPDKFFVIPNYLNFFIMDSTINLGIANWLEIVL